MSRDAFRRRAARWLLSSIFALGAVAPLPVAAFAFIDGWEGSPCTLSAWSFVTTGPVAGGPYDSTPIVRYEGGCAMRVALGGAVQSDHPASETSYRARFYVFPQTSAGAVVLFQGTNSSGVPQFSIAHDGATGAFLIYVGSGSTGTPDTSLFGVPSFRWTWIEVYYQSGLPLTITAQGSASPAPPVTVTSSVAVPPSSIDSARLGWLSTANGNPTGAINFDAFASNNLVAPIGPLCRGDADADGDIDNVDYKVLTDEILQRDIASGQPDCTEDGRLDAFDRVCVAKRAGACP